jgi:hypothetical protein
VNALGASCAPDRLSARKQIYNRNGPSDGTSLCGVDVYDARVLMDPNIFLPFIFHFTFSLEQV